MSSNSWALASDIGLRLKDLRKAVDWTQARLGEEMGRQWKAVSDWERGIRPPDMQLLEGMALRFGWPVEIFAEGGRMPSEIVNSAVINGVREESGDYSPKQTNALGVNPIQFLRIGFAITAAEGAAKTARKLFDSNFLDEAEEALRRGIEGTRRELDAGKGDGRREKGGEGNVAGGTSG